MRHLPLFLLLLCTSLTAASDALAADRSVGQGQAASDQFPDWTYWRGPHYNGISYTTGLADSWDPTQGEGSNVRWKREDLGGRSTPVEMNGRLYLITRADRGTPIEGERVVCVDAASGETLWENKFSVYLSDVPDTRVGWASVVADPETGNIYALGVADLFRCIDGETGETVWEIPLHEQFGMLSTYGGRTNFPILCDDLVIVSGIIINWGDAARPNHRLIAFDKRTGENRWFSGTRDLPDDTPYSAPSLKVINGQKTLVLGAGDGSIWGLQPNSGRVLWRYDLSRRGLFATPLVVGNRVYCSHSEENITGATMGAVAAFEIEGAGPDATVKELWKVERLVVGRSAPVLVDDRLYVVDDRAKLWVLDPETGEELSRRIALGDRKGWPSLLYADSKIYALTENGRWSILKPTEEGVEVLDEGRSRIRGEAFYSSPMVAEGRLYFQSTTALYCVEDPDKTPGYDADAVPAEPQETPVAENPQISYVLASPQEILMRPGETVSLTLRGFNSLGQLIDEIPAEDVQFEAAGPLKVAGGKLTAEEIETQDAGQVTVAHGDATSTVRVRVVPPLPWEFDFDNLNEPPVTWVGARYRHIIREIDGSPALVKITTIPKGTRSRAWMGPSDLSGYTISADVQGQQGNNQLPDIGLIAQGYVLDLQGNAQSLQIRSWAPQLRMAETVSFPWEPDKWYRMKFQADVDRSGDSPVAVLKGKVWPRDAEEPAEWTVEARDEFPVTSGSPGLFGNAKTNELYLDNIRVEENPSQS